MRVLLVPLGEILSHVEWSHPIFFPFISFFPTPRQCLESEDDLQQLQSDGVPSEVTDWLASTFTQRVRRPARRSDEKPKFRSIVHAVQAGIFVERCVALHDGASVRQGCRSRAPPYAIHPIYKIINDVRQ